MMVMEMHKKMPISDRTLLAVLGLRTSGAHQTKSTESWMPNLDSPICQLSADVLLEV